MTRTVTTLTTFQQLSARFQQVLILKQMRILVMKIKILLV